ncbi:MAG: hypothetical protein ACOCQN_03665 [Halanaerobiaceae bacterium]
MNKVLILWFVFLLIAILISSFTHEIGHGISAYMAGQPVSTGFDKVGDAGKTPADDDFREKHSQYENPWDLGPAVTLFLALLFTYLLFRTEDKLLLYLVGSLAIANSFLRLIPVVRSYFFLLFTGAPALEDEIGMGILWSQITGIQAIKHIPSLISIIVSIICLIFIYRGFRKKLPLLFSNRYFTIVSLTALLVAIPVIKILDKYVRINWGS